MGIIWTHKDAELQSSERECDRLRQQLQRKAEELRSANNRAGRAGIGGQPGGVPGIFCGFHNSLGDPLCISWYLLAGCFIFNYW